MKKIIALVSLSLFCCTASHAGEKDRTLDIRETPEFLDGANRVRQGLREGHSYVD